MVTAHAEPKPMLSDILRQPEILKGLLLRRSEFLAIGRGLLGPCPGALPGGRVFAFGCGDGWFAARAVAHIALAAFSVPLVPCSSLEMLMGGGARLTSADRGIAISMSGCVERTIEAAASIATAGGICLALSNTDGGPLSRVAIGVASLHVPQIAPFPPGTTRYSATILALMLLLEGAGGTKPSAMHDLQAVLEGPLPETLDIAQRACRTLCPSLVRNGIGGVRVLGAGADWATACYGAAKLVKLIGKPVWGGEMEEFAHSQFWGARPDELVILLAGTRRAAALAENTAEALSVAGLRSLAIETAGVPVPSATYRFTLPEVPGWLAPLIMPAPLQVFAYYLTLALGRDPGFGPERSDPARFLAAQMLVSRFKVPQQV